MMKVLGVAACLSLAGCSLFPTASDRTEEDKIKVGELLAVVKKAAADAQSEIAAGGPSKLPPLASLTLTMQTKEVAGGSVSVELLIVSGQVKGEKAVTQTVTIKLT